MTEQRPTIDDLLDQWEAGFEQGEAPSISDLCKEAPEFESELVKRIGILKQTQWMVESSEESDLPPLPNLQDNFAIPSDLTLDQFVSAVASTGLITESELMAMDATDASELASQLQDQNQLTSYQINQIAKGKGSSLVLGNYIVVDQIGSGGMGQVFKARHRRMDRIVAIKTLPKEAVSSSSAIERFQREVKAAAKLEHPNIVTAHDADEFNGTHFLVMQCVEGLDLFTYVHRHGPLTNGQAIDCVLQAARGLEYAHQKGIIHRDIKPSNLFLDKDGTVKILDMGLARSEHAYVGDHASTEVKLTIDGSVMGTVDYMSPEQAFDATTADNRSDIYSLGCTLFYLLTGDTLFEGSTMMAKLLAHRESEIPTLEDNEVNGVFQRMVAKKPEERFQAAHDLVVELERLAERFASDVSFLVLDETETRPIPSVVETSSIHGAETIERRPQPAIKPALKKGTQPWPVSGKWIAGVILVVLIALVAFGAPFLYDINFKVDTPGGIVQIESSHPDLDVFVDGDKVIYITDPNDNTKIKVEVPRGAKMMRVTKEGFEADVKEFNLTTVEGPIEVTFTPIVENSEREIAQWLLSKPGGYVHVVVDGQTHQVNSLADLPNEPFSVVQAGNNDINTGLTDDDMIRLARLPNLQVLDFYAVPVTDAGLSHLTQIESLTNLNFLHCKRFSLQGLAGFANLENLVIGDAPQIKNRDLKHLRQYANLRILNIAGNPQFTDEAMTYIGELPELRNLGLDASSITDEGAKHLKKLSRLEAIGLNRTGIGDTTLAYLSGLSELVVVHLTNTKVTDNGLESLAQVEWLRDLDLLGTAVTDNGLVYLKDCDTLRWLRLDDTKITDEGLKHLYGLKLNKLELNDTAVSATGIAELKKAIPDCEIVWNSPPEAELPHIRIVPQPPEITAGQPISPVALVSLPPKIDRVLNWTIETVGHRNNVMAVAYKPDGSMLGTGSTDGTIRLWDPRSGRFIRAFVGHAQVNFMDWSPDGSYLASAHYHDSVRIWHVDTGSIVRVIQEHGGPVSWSPNGETLAIGGLGGVHLWNVVNGAFDVPLTGDAGEAKCLCWSPNGAFLASGSSDQTVRIWNIDSGESQVLKGHTTEVRSLAWSSNGKLLASGGLHTDPDIRIWDPASGQLQKTMEKPPQEHSVGLVWLKNDKILASVSSLTMRLWNAETAEKMQETRVYPGAGRTVDYSPFTNTIATGGELNTVWLVDIESGARVHELRGYLTPTIHNNDAGFWSPDGKTLVTLAQDVIRFWDIRTGDLVRTSQGGRSVAWSPDGTTVACVGSNNRIWIRDSRSGETVQTLKGATKQVDCITYSPGGDRLVASGPGGAFWLWNIESGELVRTWKSPQQVMWLYWSPDGAWLATQIRDNGVVLWDTDTWQARHELTTHYAVGFNSVAWSSDGKKLAFGAEGHSVGVWDVDRESVTQQFKGHTADVTNVQWMDNGEKLASLGRDRTLRLWDTASGQLLSTTVAPETGSFSPDGSLLVSAISSTLQLRQTNTAMPLMTIIMLEDDKAVSLSPDGHIRTTSDVSEDFVWVVQTPEGQESLSLEEFSTKYGWKNDPERVRLGTASE